MSKEVIILLVISQLVNVISFVCFEISKRALRKQMEEAQKNFDAEVEAYRQAALRLRSQTEHPAGTAAVIFMESLSNKLKGKPAMTVQESLSGEKTLFRHYIPAEEIEKVYLEEEPMKDPNKNNVVQVDFSSRSK